VTPIDVTMTAACRPELVFRTLKSFKEMLFDRLPVRAFFLNVDPVWGTKDQGREVEAIGRSFFNSVEVRFPLTGSYGGAVKWLWSRPETEWFLHLEDDWTMTNRISLNRLTSQMNSGAAQIVLANWKRLQRQRKPPKLGLCPLFSKREFGRLASGHMNPDLDPDKQFRNGTNPALEQAIAGYHAVYFGGALTRETIVDIGRDWRQDRKIEKKIIDGVSVWTGGNS
jgi:hypothetical protein